jgi:hypothetical protein
MAIPVAALWQDTMAFVRRESALLVPLSLATLGIGDASLNLLAGVWREAMPAPPPTGTGLGMLLAVLWSVVGQLAIMALALSRGGLSVGEALRLASWRLPRVVIVGITLLWAVTILLLPLLLMLTASGVDLGTPNPKIPPLASFYGFLISGIIVWIGVRLAPMNAAIVDRNPTVLAAFRDTFRLTRGHAAILLGLAALYLLAWVLGTSIATGLVGLIFIPASAALGIPFAGKVMVALGGAMVASGLGMIAAVFMAKLYRHLSESGPAAS